MLTNADMTLYHKTLDPATRRDVWTRTQYQGVNWYAQTASSVLADGLKQADTLTVQIPETAAPDGFPGALGDIVVKGLIDDEITGPGQLKHHGYFTVTAVRDCRYGSPYLRHWQLEGA